MKHMIDETIRRLRTKVKNERIYNIFFKVLTGGIACLAVYNLGYGIGEFIYHILH